MAARGEARFAWWQTTFVREGSLPSFRNPQQLPKDPALAEKTKEKINKARSCRYIVRGQVLSLTYYFHLNEGESHICIVLKLIAFGLNITLWAPPFWMPTVSNVSDCATHVLWFVEIDAGEMFLNYRINRSIRPFAGVDVSWI